MLSAARAGARVGEDVLAVLAEATQIHVRAGGATCADCGALVLAGQGSRLRIAEYEIGVRSAELVCSRCYGAQAAN